MHRGHVRQRSGHNLPEIAYDPLTQSPTTTVDPGSVATTVDPADHRTLVPPGPVHDVVATNRFEYTKTHGEFSLNNNTIDNNGGHNDLQQLLPKPNTTHHHHDLERKMRGKLGPPISNASIFPHRPWDCLVFLYYLFLAPRELSICMHEHQIAASSETTDDDMEMQERQADTIPTGVASATETTPRHHHHHHHIDHNSQQQQQQQQPTAPHQHPHGLSYFSKNGKKDLSACVKWLLSYLFYVPALSLVGCRAIGIFKHVAHGYPRNTDTSNIFSWYPAHPSLGRDIVNVAAFFIILLGFILSGIFGDRQLPSRTTRPFVFAAIVVAMVASGAATAAFLWISFTNVAESIVIPFTLLLFVAYANSILLIMSKSRARAKVMPALLGSLLAGALASRIWNNIASLFLAVRIYDYYSVVAGSFGATAFLTASTVSASPRRVNPTAIVLTLCFGCAALQARSFILAVLYTAIFSACIWISLIMDESNEVRKFITSWKGCTAASLLVLVVGLIAERISFFSIAAAPIQSQYPLPNPACVLDNEDCLESDGIQFGSSTTPRCTLAIAVAIYIALSIMITKTVATLYHQSRRVLLSFIAVLLAMVVTGQNVNPNTAITSIQGLYFILASIFGTLFLLAVAFRALRILDKSSVYNGTAAVGRNGIDGRMTKTMTRRLGVTVVTAIVLCLLFTLIINFTIRNVLAALVESFDAQQRASSATSLWTSTNTKLILQNNLTRTREALVNGCSVLFGMFGASVFVGFVDLVRRGLLRNIKQGRIVRKAETILFFMLFIIAHVHWWISVAEQIYVNAACDGLSPCTIIGYGPL